MSGKNLNSFLQTNSIQAEHLYFSQSCHSVAEAASAAKADPDDFVKSICMIDRNNLIVAIVAGTDRASAAKVGSVLNIAKPRIATPAEVLSKTGYPVGGVPPFGYSATFLIDKKVLEKHFVYGGGGSEQSLIKISPVELQKANKAIIANIV
ncbi:MAG: YbaK/EbsC family protein [Candidatus Woesearchaeota archaeon]